MNVLFSKSSDSPSCIQEQESNVAISLLKIVSVVVIQETYAYCLWTHK